jgi:UrcA family protein
MIASRVLVALISACALAAVFFAPRVTHADSAGQLPTEAVRYGDLDLDTRSGIETLFRRIRIAAAEVCREYEPQGTRLPSSAYRSCTRNAISRAVGNVDSPLLKAYYNEREHRDSLITASR